MRILLLNKYHYRKGGAERAYFDMADMLSEAGHEVAFFAMEHPKNIPTPWSKYFVSGVDYADTEVSFLQKVRSAIRIIWNHEANKKLAALIEDFQPDVAHAHNIYHQLSPSIFHVLKRKGIPIVLTLHDYKLVSPNYNLYANGHIWDHASGLRCIADRCIQGSVIKSAICTLEKWVHSVLGSYHLVSVLISPSQFLATKAVELGWRGKPIAVIPNPLRESELSQSLSQTEIVQNRLVFFGRLSAEKGIDQALRAVAAVPGKEFRIIGEGPAQESLRALTKELGMEERVQFIGARYGADLQNELRTAEAVIIPSVWYENLPYVVTESLALGLVVAAAASGGITERIIHGKNGFLYQLGDTESLVQVLTNLEQHDLTALRHEAQKSVRDLAPEIFLKKLEALYKSVL